MSKEKDGLRVTPEMLSPECSTPASHGGDHLAHSQDAGTERPAEPSGINKRKAPQVTKDCRRSVTGKTDINGE